MLYLEYCLYICVAKQRNLYEYMKNQNEMYQKEKTGLLTTTEIAGIVGCSESLIRQVRTGERKANKGKGAIIKQVDELNQEAEKIAKTTLVEYLEKLIPLK